MRAGRLAIRPDWLLAAVGLAGLVVAVALRPSDAAAAAAQDWSPSVLVAGLLLIGLVADDDGLFAAAGSRLAAATRSGTLLFAGSVLLVSIVTATLNLDTSVAFLTPVLVHTARSRGEGEPAFLYGCLLLSNAASLLLPGSNLTNLIVLGHLHLTGGQFAARMWLPWLGAVIITAAVVAIGERRSLGPVTTEPGQASRPVLGIGLAAIVAATVLVIVIRDSALPVFVIGALAAGFQATRGGELTVGRIWQVLGVPVLAGLFGAAVALGTLGRAWSGPEVLLSHLSGWATAAFAALATAVVNNLPAASMLAARTPAHPLHLLIGLNLGPNLCVTGSLAWLLWIRSARDAGARPSLARASRLGIVAVPLSIAVAVAALAVTGGAQQ
ncbi:MAG TPA: SLC13 family permease [Streptosporangiaceae bacterium]|nr:SLC13 family permease [Streptosporangiaceae bacterium]